MDRTAANLTKLEEVWDRARAYILGTTERSQPAYDDLQRAWNDLLVGLPPIDGWTITSQLPDVDEGGYLYLDVGEEDRELSTREVLALRDKPGSDLAEYRYKLHRARRTAARERLQQLTAIVDSALARLLNEVDRDSRERLESPDV
jgi:hypothetical protein